MAIEKITMPQLGESVTEGTISKWLVKPGDYVNKYDPLAEVITDKVNAEIPSSFSGTIKELVADEDETLAIGEVICLIEAEQTEKDSGTDQVSDIGQRMEQEQELNKGNSQKGKTRYSPAVLKLSQEHNIDLTQIQGSGKEGRITRKDVQKIIDAGGLPQRKNNIEHRKESFTQTVPGDIEIPVSNVRKAIASNLLRSKHEIPHAWMMIEADVTGLVQYRDSIKDSFKQREGYNLTYFAFFVKAVALALKEFPMLNSTWAGDKIIQKREINLSIAVAAEDALYVPVIKNADELSIKGIAKEISALANEVQSGTLKKESIEGGTFTVNNTGTFGSVESMGIINYPQAAILQVESIVKRPVVVDQSMIAIRDMVNLCLSLDHRVLDGLVCGRFLQRVKDLLENITAENTPLY